MIRTLIVAILPVFTVALLPACSSLPEDELAGEADDAAEGKADTPGGASTYYAIKADNRRCTYPACGGFHIDRLNATTTKCHDGSRSTSCYTPVLDWSESRLSQAKQDMLEAAASKGAMSDAVIAIVRGRFLINNTTTPQPELGRFVVTEAWVAQGEGASNGVFAKVLETGLRCAVDATCPSIKEKALNSSRTDNIAEIDFALGNFDEAAIVAVSYDTVEPSGAIIVGDRYTFTVRGSQGKGRTADNMYRNLANVAAPATGEACYRGGCSGQICSDRPNVISTCEWRAEYACYRDATCERQADGGCGWTQTPELEACIGSSN
jgi:hypothetical protein